jgi:hypothetical protein
VTKSSPRYQVCNYDEAPGVSARGLIAQAGAAQTCVVRASRRAVTKETCMGIQELLAGQAAVVTGGARKSAGPAQEISRPCSLSRRPYCPSW